MAANRLNRPEDRDRCLIVASRGRERYAWIYDADFIELTITHMTGMALNPETSLTHKDLLLLVEKIRRAHA